MTYLYRCGECGRELQREYPLGLQPDAVTCPSCGGVAARRYTAAAVVYRGGGWAGQDAGAPDPEEMI